MKRILYAVVCIVLALALALVMFSIPRPAAAPVSEASYKDVSYEIEGKSVTLGAGGIAYFGNDAKGDLNGDGKEDIAFLLTSQPGGSGTFFYVAAALKTDSGYIGTNAVLLGDRIAPQNTSIQDGDIIVNYADRKPSEPMTAQPSVGVTSYFKMDGSKLVYEGSR